MLFGGYFQETAIFFQIAEKKNKTLSYLNMQTRQQTRLVTARVTHTDERPQAPAEPAEGADDTIGDTEPEEPHTRTPDSVVRVRNQDDTRAEPLDDGSADARMEPLIQPRAPSPVERGDTLGAPWWAPPNDLRPFGYYPTPNGGSGGGSGSGLPFSGGSETAELVQALRGLTLAPSGMRASQFPAPKFHGKSDELLEDWLQSLAEYSTAVGWDLPQRMKALPLLLGGRAKQVYDGIPTTEKTWGNTVKRLQETFGFDPTRNLLNFHNLDRVQKEDESVTDYAQDLLKRLKVARITDERHLMASFFRGLLPAIKDKLITMRSETFAELEKNATIVQLSLNNVTPGASDKVCYASTERRVRFRDRNDGDNSGRSVPRPFPFPRRTDVRPGRYPTQRGPIGPGYGSRFGPHRGRHISGRGHGRPVQRPRSPTPRPGAERCHQCNRDF